MIADSAPMIAGEMTTPLSTGPAKAAKRRSRKRTLQNLMLRDGVWYFHKFVKGQRFFHGKKTPFSLDTRDEAVARAKRDAILRAANGAEVDRILGRDVAEEATLEELVAAYRNADYPREDSRKQAIRALKLVLKRAAGGEEQDLKRLTSLSLGKLVVQDFQDDVVRTARLAGHADGSEGMATAKFSANRTLAKARSVWANEKCFRKLKVTKPAAFLEADDFVVHRDLAYRPMSAAEVALFGAESFRLRARMLAGRPERREHWRGVWATWLLMRFMGLRNEEVEHCKPAEWIEHTATGWVLQIRNRDYFQVKGVGSVRSMPLADWLLHELVALAGAKIEGKKVVGGREWLIPGANPTARFDVTHRALNRWMASVYRLGRMQGVLPKDAEARTAYDWRKQAGSELYQKTKDILQVSKWLGHRSVHTTTKWYVNVIGGLPSLA